MKKMSVTISVLVLALATFAQAQTQTNYIKNARIQLEKDNESKILEMLETQRLQEEQARMVRFEQVSFSVLQEPTAQVYVVPTQSVDSATSQTF